MTAVVSVENRLQQWLLTATNKVSWQPDLIYAELLTTDVVQPIYWNAVPTKVSHYQFQSDLTHPSLKTLSLPCITRASAVCYLGTHTLNRLTALCRGLPGWAGTKRNIHPLTSMKRKDSHRQQNPLRGSSSPLQCFEPATVVRPHEASIHAK